MLYKKLDHAPWLSFLPGLKHTTYLVHLRERTNELRRTKRNTPKADPGCK